MNSGMAKQGWPENQSDNSCISLVYTPQSVVTLLQLGGLRAPETSEAMPAGVLIPGGFNHAGQALGERPD